MTKITFVNGTTPAVNATNLNQMQTNIENAINGVVTKGNNANGNYVKFQDGTLICYASKTGTSSLSDYWSFANRTNAISVTFPSTFVTTPSVSLGLRLENAQVSGGISGTTTTRFSCIILKPKGVTDTNYSFDYIAIGKWK